MAAADGHCMPAINCTNSSSCVELITCCNGISTGSRSLTTQQQFWIYMILLQQQQYYYWSCNDQSSSAAAAGCSSLIYSLDCNLIFPHQKGFSRPDSHDCQLISLETNSMIICLQLQMIKCDNIGGFDQLGGFDFQVSLDQITDQRTIRLDQIRSWAGLDQTN